MDGPKGKKRSSKNRGIYCKTKAKAKLKVANIQNLVPTSKIDPAEDILLKILPANIWKLTITYNYNYKFCVTDAQGEAQCGQGGRGSKIGEILRKSLMDGS